MPTASSAQYIDSIIRVCREHKIDAIFIGSQEELLPIAKARSQIEIDTDVKVLTNPINVITTAADKWQTYIFLKGNNLPCPESVLPHEDTKLIKEFGFPIVVKPREGHGSLHFYVVKNKDELEQAISKIKEFGWNPILQEYIIGKDNEFTSGVTVSKSGEIMSSISMRRELKNGQTYKAFIDDHDKVRRSAEETSLKIGAMSAINIQAKVLDDKPKILEINPRFSASCPIRAVAGINEPDIVFRNLVLGEEIKISLYQKLVCMRYWNELYVPYSTYQKACSVGNLENSDAYTVDYF